MLGMTSVMIVDYGTDRIRMYRIVKRIVRTITVVTWVIRYANAEGHTVEEEIMLPEIHQVNVQELPDPVPPSSKPHSSHDTNQQKG
jgi:hypothetical protein